MAQDFWQAFYLGGTDSLGINSNAIDEVNLAVVKALEARTTELREKTARIMERETRLCEHHERFEEIDARNVALEARNVELESQLKELAGVRSELDAIKALLRERLPAVTPRRASSPHPER